ncbi:uncharacterized protein C6orf136 homolog [Cyanocitta cristata]
MQISSLHSFALPPAEAWICKSGAGFKRWGWSQGATPPPHHDCHPPLGGSLLLPAPSPNGSDPKSRFFPPIRRSPPWALARPLALLPPPRCPQARPPGTPPRGLEGLGGPVTTVDGRREDDIAVRDPPRLLLGPPRPPPGHRRDPPRPPAQPPRPWRSTWPTMHEKLRHELPNFFLKIPDYALYAPDVIQCQLLRLHTRGRAMYAVAVALCRALAWGYFASLRLEVLALTRHPEDWSVRARWRLTGLPLHLLLLRWYRRDKRALLRSYDAFSTFFLNSQGLIRCHPRGQADASPHGRPRAQEAAGGRSAGRGPGPALKPPRGTPERPSPLGVSPLSPPLSPPPPPPLT